MSVLTSLRKAAGYSQRELARQSGVKQGVISLIESGETKHPRIDTMQKLSRALGCSIDELLSDWQDRIRR